MISAPDDDDDDDGGGGGEGFFFFKRWMYKVGKIVFLRWIHEEEPGTSWTVHLHIVRWTRWCLFPGC